MNVKMYKYLYKLMKDDLADATIETDYAYCAKEEGEEELAKYFATKALERLNKSFKETHAMFENAVKKEENFDKECITKYLWDEIHEDMIETYET